MPWETLFIIYVKSLKVNKTSAQPHLLFSLVYKQLFSKHSCILGLNNNSSFLCFVFFLILPNPLSN